MEEFKRKLALIRKIAEVLPIDGADNIELVKIDGWQCITKKGDFKPGDLCVYFEIDSFLPIHPEFEFLRKSSYKKMGDKQGFRLKTIKLRGNLSQGLVLPVTIFTPCQARFNFLETILDGLEEGKDVTDIIGVLKYDPPIPAQLVGVCKGNFPSFIRKTDQERVQNIWNKIKDSKESFEVTVKLDGTSCTYYLNDCVFGVCSRNLDLIETEGNTLWKLARELKIEERLREYGKNIALQGEVIGEGVQGNPEGIKGQKFFIFDIWDIDAQEYFVPGKRFNMLSTYPFYKFYMRPLENGNRFIDRLDIIPILYEHITLENFNCLEDLLVFANGNSLRSETREGVVFKSNDSDLTFKVISNEYLLKNKES